MYSGRNYALTTRNALALRFIPYLHEYYDADVAWSLVYGDDKSVSLVDRMEQVTGKTPDEFMKTFWNDAKFTLDNIFATSTDKLGNLTKDEWNDEIDLYVKK